jgi:hypothetical protein
MLGDVATYNFPVLMTFIIVIIKAIYLPTLFTAVLPITTILVTSTLGQVSVCSSSFTSNMSRTNNTEEAAQVARRGDDANV